MIHILVMIIDQQPAGASPRQMIQVFFLTAEICTASHNAKPVAVGYSPHKQP